MDIYPALTYRDVDGALVFLVKAFGLEVDGRVLVQPDLPEELHGSHLGHGWVYVTVADVDAHCARARGAGAQVSATRTVRRTARFAVTAPATAEGNLWSFGTDRPGG